MHDPGRAPLATRPWLAPLVPLYRFGIALRGLALRSGFEEVRKLGAPVVSIGNLSTGGAGKTPLTIALPRALTARGVHIDVLSRGYGRTGKAIARVDPNGTAEDFGDEPLVIAREACVPVYVAAQRYQAGLLAEHDFSGAHKPKRQRVGTRLQGLWQNTRWHAPCNRARLQLCRRYAKKSRGISPCSRDSSPR